MRSAFVVVVALACAGCGGHGTKKVFNNGELYYTSRVTAEEADRCGDFLVKDGFFDGARKTVQLDRKDGVVQFRAVVKPGVDSDQAYQFVFKVFAWRLSHTVFNGEPVEVHFCDERLKTLRTLAPTG